MSMMKRWTCVSCGTVSHKKGMVLGLRETEKLLEYYKKEEVKMCMPCWRAKQQENAKTDK